MKFASNLLLALLQCSALATYTKKTNEVHGNLREVEDQRSTTENVVVQQKKMMKNQIKKTAKPTAKPTKKPTKSPTKSPTKKPTTNTARMLVTFEGRTGMMTAKSDSNVQILMEDPSWDFMVMNLSPQQVNQYKNDPNIKSIEIDYEMKTLGMPIAQDDMDETHRELAESTPWGITAVLQNVDFFKNLNVKGPKKVCIADTGYNLGHVDLPSGNDVTGMDATGEINEKWSFDGGQHGTHCAGTVAAKGGNNQGVVGIIPDNKQGNFQLVIGKALSQSGSGSASSVMKAVQGCVDQGANVISLSLGCDNCPTQTENNFYTNLYKSKNVLIVAAGGNGGNSAKSYPASYGAVMSVGAITQSLQRSSFSQYNDQVEIAAPGSGIQSTIPGNNYATWDGTSMATPHVAGVAGLLWMHFPECKNYQIRNVILKTAKDIDSSGCEVRTGYGLVQAQNAYNLLAKGGCGGNLGTADPVGGCKQLSNQPGPTPTPPPTGTPTKSPTPPPQNPTRKPTNSPTPPAQTPTRKPTNSPTRNPTNSPTRNPTNSPTNAPNTDDYFNYDDYKDDYFNYDDYDLVEVEIVIKTDKYPEDTSWELYDSSGIFVSSGGGNYSPWTVYRFKKNLARGCYTFIFYDDYGDGVCCKWGYGYYKIFYDGYSVVNNGGNFVGSEISEEFGDC